MPVQFVTSADGLLELPLAFGEFFALPDGFQCGVVGENDWSEIFLRDQFRLGSEMVIASFNLFIDGQTDWLLLWVVDVVDQFERCIGERDTIARFRMHITPVGQINAGLQFIRDADFDLVSKIYFLKTVVRRFPRLPRYPVF